MNIATMEATKRATGWELYQLEDVNQQLDAVMGAVTDRMNGAVPPGPGQFKQQLETVRAAHKALTDVTGHDALADAALAAREVLPHVERATQVLEALEGHTIAMVDLKPLLADLGAAMDRIEQLLGAAGFD